MKRKPVKDPCCLNLDCALHGQFGKSNVIRHSFYKTSQVRRRRYLCKACEKTFGSTAGTPYYRLQKPRATFDEVADFIEHSHDNTFAVTGPDGELVGVIRYSQLRTVLFDGHLGSLVCAADLAVPCSLVLYPDDPITRTQEHFRRGSEDDLPVAADEESKRFVGVVRRRDLFRLFSRSRRDTE